MTLGMPALSGEAWTAIGTIGAAAVAAVAGTVSAWLSRVSASRSQAAQQTAAEARDLSRPTGNGYADETREALATVIAQVTTLVDAVGRVERRQDAAAVTAAKASELLAGHLADHARAGLHGHH